MKKMMIATALFGLVFVTGCGDDKAETPAAPAASAEQQATADKAAADVKAAADKAAADLKAAADDAGKKAQDAAKALTDGLKNLGK